MASSLRRRNRPNRPNQKQIRKAAAVRFVRGSAASQSKEWRAFFRELERKERG